MRDPNRIPMILAAVERRWKEQPDMRLGQLLINVTRGHDPFNVEDGKLLELLGPQTEEERQYIDKEPQARQRARGQWTRRTNSL